MRIKTFITLLLLLAMAGIAEEWMTFTTDDGLPQNTCTCIEVDHDGIVWVGAAGHPTGLGGVSSWDGETWTTYFSWTTDYGLRNDAINDIFVDSDNNKWIATGTFVSIGGVTKFDGETWTYYNLDSLAPFNFECVYCIQEDNDGNIWVGGWLGLCVINEHEILFYDSEYIGCEGSFWSISCNNIYNIAIGSDNGIIFFDGDSFVTMESSVSQQILSTKMSDSIFCYGTYRNGAFIVNGSEITNFTNDSGLRSNSVTSIYIFSQDSIWFGNTLLSVYHQEIVTTFDIPDLTGFRFIKDIEKDLNGNIWLCNSTSGLIVYNRNSIEWGIHEEMYCPPDDCDFDIFPNPFNSSCNILSDNAFNLTIYDIHGKIVEIEPNISSFTWHPDDLQSGVYIVTAKNKNSSICKKVTYIK